MNQQSTQQQYLVISALGQDRPGIVNDLAMHVVDAGCNIIDSRMAVLGGEFAIMMMVEGAWSAVAKLETQLPGLQKKLGLTVITKRTEEHEPKSGGRPYMVEVIAMDHPGIVYKLANFFSSRNINIQDLNTDSYRAAHTGAQMFSANLTVNIPAHIHVARLREEFLDFCDGLNLDAVLEPVKG